MERGVKPTESLLIAFDDIRDHPRLVALVGKARLDDRYAALWLSIEGMESTEIHGLEPAMHQARGRELAKLGYRVAGISAFHPEEKGAVVVSAWQRPTLKEPDRLRDAERRVLAALALLRLGEPEAAWDRLRNAPDPNVATALTHGLVRAGVSPGLILARLQAEPRADVRRSLLLALGDEAESAEFGPFRERSTALALALFRDDPDPGVHSAAEWLARTLGAGREVEASRKSLASPVTTGPRGWYVNGQGQTFAVIRGPVEFTMGAPASDGDQFTLGEANQHRRRIPRTFAMATKEVTNAEFRRFLDENPDVAHRDELAHSLEPDAPVFNVSWRDSARYCRWLTAREGLAEDQQPYALVPPAPGRPPGRST